MRLVFAGFIRSCLACVLMLMLSAALAADTKLGVVVLHGKWGNPSGYTLPLAKHLENAGYLVVSPEMPWSMARQYDAGIAGMMADIDGAMQSLKAKGATKICLAGHSMGGAGALYYAGHRPIDCLIILAPGHNPEGRVMRGLTEKDLATAKDMVAKGEAEASAWFEDYNVGNRSKKIRMAAKTYIEYFDGDGPMNMANNASHVLPGTHVLWIVGAEEADGPKRLGGAAFKALPAELNKKFVEVPGGHLATPEKAMEITAAWIRENIN